VTIDGFRFDQNGKIVEHGDPMRQIPEESARLPTRRKSQAVERPEP
jgi:predicted SnoaL-like aldol condensation-catalyzing enzyme